MAVFDFLSHAALAGLPVLIGNNIHVQSITRPCRMKGFCSIMGLKDEERRRGI